MGGLALDKSEGVVRKLALMNGSTLTKAFVSLPGGAQAVYNTSGLQYYRHPDWLGSSRLATTPSRTKYFDVAYAPFGENYAGSGTQDRHRPEPRHRVQRLRRCGWAIRFHVPEA